MNFNTYFQTPKIPDEIKILKAQNIKNLREIAEILVEGSYTLDPDENQSTGKKAQARVAVLQAQMKLNAQVIAKIKAALAKKDTSKLDATILNLQKAFQNAQKKYQAVK